MGTVAADSVALLCRGLVKRFGDVVAVDGLDLEVHRGECFGLLGPNGAGKTTTIEILEGLLAPDAGDVRVLGRRWADAAAALRPRLGIQLQETQLADKLTVEETLRLFRSFYPTGPTIDALLDTVELASKRDAWVSKLSGGQKQRLSVACALAGQPELLFLDEPTTGLDPQSRRQLWDGARALPRRRRHHPDHDPLHGRGARAVRSRRHHGPGAPHRARHAARARRVARRGAHGGVRHRRGPHAGGGGPARAARRPRRAPRRARRRWPPPKSTRTVPALLDLLRAHDASLSQLSTHSATLEDVFVTLTGRQLRDE